MSAKKKSFNANASIPTPGLRTGRRGRAPNQRPSLFVSSFGGRCRGCGGPIKAGEYVSTGRNGGMVHPQCMGAPGEPSTKISSTSRSSTPGQSVSQKQLPTRKRPVVAKAKADPKGARNRTNVPRDTEVDKSELPEKITRLVAETRCTVCDVPYGVKCVGSQMKWVHKGRADLFLKQHR